MDNNIDLNINNEELLKNKFNSLKELSDSNETKRNIFTGITLSAKLIFLIVFWIISCMASFTVELNGFYGGYYSDVIQFTLFIGFILLFSYGAVKYCGGSKKKEFTHPMSKMFMELCFDNVESNDESIITPESFSQYDLVKYNWLDGSDMFRFKYKNKDFVVQDIIIYEYDKTKDKDKEIFKGQYISSTHNLDLEEEIILRSKNFDKWTEFEDNQIYMFNDEELDSKYEVISQNNNEHDIILLNKNIDYIKNNLLHNKLLINSNSYFAIKFYPNGYYVQILNTDKDLFEAKNVKTYEAFKANTLKDIATIIPQLNIVNNLE